MPRLPRVVAIALFFPTLAGAIAWTAQDPTRLNALAQGSEESLMSSHKAAAPRASASTTADDPVTIVAAGDIACDPRDVHYEGGSGTRRFCAQERTADLVRATDPDAVMALGDMQNDDGLLWKFRRSFDRSWGEFSDMTYPVLGNHEYWSGDPDGYFDYWRGRKVGKRGKGWYTFKLGAWEVYALNSQCEFGVPCHRGGAQWRWLRRELAASSTDCQLAMFHQPFVSSGPHGPNQRLAPIWKLLDRADVDVALTAHDELYERLAPVGADGRPSASGVRQFVVGTGGDQLYWVERRHPASEVVDAKSFGVLEMGLDDRSFTWRFHSAGPGRLRDAGRSTCA
jgi:hypothetical protein